MSEGLIDTPPEPLRLQLPADRSSLITIREQLSAFLTAHGIEETHCFDALLVASELAANAVEHGSQPGDVVEILCEVRGDEVWIRVLDCARGSIPVSLSPDPTRAHGRGLAIVERLSLSWSETIRNGRREVSARLAT